MIHCITCDQPKSTAKGEDVIQDAIEQQLALCQCAQWYPVQRVDEGIYRVCTPPSLYDRYQLVVCVISGERTLYGAGTSSLSPLSFR